MLSTPTIASLAIDAVSPEGEAFVVEIEVGTPSLEKDDVWACSMALGGIFAHGPIYGESSLQSLCLTLSLIAKILENFLGKGGQLLLEGSEFPLKAYFGRLTFADRSPETHA